MASLTGLRFPTHGQRWPGRPADIGFSEAETKGAWNVDPVLADSGSGLSSFELRRRVAPPAAHSDMGDGRDFNRILVSSSKAYSASGTLNC